MNRKVAFLALLILYGCGKPATPDAGDDEKKPTFTVELTKVTAQPMDDYVSLPGAFSPSEGGLAKLAPSVAGKIAKVLVREGDLVRKGQLLVLLDRSVASAQESSARAAADAAKIQSQQSDTNLLASKADQRNTLETARIALEQAKSEGASSVAQARYTLLQSEADLQKLKAGARPQEIAQAHEATVQAAAAKNRAQSELDRDEALSADGYVSKRELEDARTALETATSALAAARDNEQLLRAGARPEELRAAEARTGSAVEALRAAERAAQLQVAAAETAYAHAQRGNLQVIAKQQDLATSRAAATQKAADLAASRANLDLYRITAPFDGTIVKRAAAAGDPADPATPVIYIQRKGAQTNFVAGGLPEQVETLFPSMRVQISANEKTYAGKVLSVSPPEVAGGPATVRIAVEGSGAPGTFGTARIIVRHHSSMPTVPDSAIVEKDGKEIVFKDVNGVATQTEVKVGSKSDGKTAILSGLKAGDPIVASGGNELDDGTKISSAPATSSELKDKD